jgi:hypothetical protein
MDFKSSVVIDVTSVQGAGVAIARTGIQQNHIALLFVDEFDDNAIKLLHVGGHKSSLVENFSGHYLWADLKCIPPLRRPSLLASILQIAKVNQTPGIKYGFNHGLYCFDPKTGFINTEYQHTAGFTCATFVIEVLLSQGVKILDWDTWPAASEEDRQFQGAVLQYLERLSKKDGGLVSEEYLLAQRSKIGSPRFKPQEVAIATQTKEVSVWTDIQEPAAQLNDALEQTFEQADT